jgi:hypothetical protein
MENKIVTPWEVSDGDELDEDDEYILSEMEEEDMQDPWE